MINFHVITVLAGDDKNTRPRLVCFKSRLYIFTVINVLYLTEITCFKTKLRLLLDLVPYAVHHATLTIMGYVGRSTIRIIVSREMASGLVRKVLTKGVDSE